VSRPDSTSSGLLIIGVGNRDRGDDAVGLVVAEKLRQLLPHTKVIESSGEPAGLIDAWTGKSRVLLVDAIQSGANVGAITRLDVSTTPLPFEVFRGSTHILGIGEAVELSRVLGSLPPKVIFYGIEAASYDHGEPMAPEVAAAASQVCERIIQELGPH
jgi:hydrogenase maturation protease